MPEADEAAVQLPDWEHRKHLGADWDMPLRGGKEEDDWVMREEWMRELEAEMNELEEEIRLLWGGDPVPEEGWPMVDQDDSQWDEWDWEQWDTAMNGPESEL